MLEVAPMMRADKKILLFVALVYSSLILTNQAVFGASLSVSITPDSASMAMVPGQFNTTTQTISITTSNSAGYRAKIATIGTSSALINQVDDSKTIPTFTLPGGSSSIPVESLGEGYGYSIDDGANFYPVPEPSSSSVELFHTTSAGTYNHALLFGAKIPLNTTAGTYSNTFNIMVVANLEPCPADNICYYGNEDDGTGTMENQPASSNSDITLIASNYSRSGYGFAGWNTAIDGSGTNYGPNETITTGDLSLEGLQLYAVWVQSSDNLQEWNGCNDLNQGEVVALTDTRDGNTYAVTKYADGQCWMMENLRLDLSATDLIISNQNTNNPTADFINTINNTHPASTNSFCANNNATCVNRILHNTNNINRNLTASYEANNTSSSWYSYGNYYNWHTVTAGNGNYEDSTAGAAVNGDICPSHWRLPTGHGIAGDLAKLDIAYGGSGVNQKPETPAVGLAGSIRWRKYPLNFIYSGEQKGGTASNRAYSSSYATQSIANVERTSNLWLKPDSVFMNSNITYKYRGQTARCLFKGNPNVIGNIHYDSNGGTGTMADETSVNFSAAVAANNEFTREHKTFVGWNTQANGNGITVVEGGMVANAAESLSLSTGDTLTLYAMWESVYSLVYDGNNADAGSMTSVTVNPLETGKHRLIASNFSRSGYGFAGWSLDSNAGSKLLNGQSVSVYGPDETITVNSAFLNNADPTTNQITLYAVWLPEDSTYTMQSFDATECNAMGVGEVIALRDTRDNDTYAVAKLEDSHCWMIENLRLDPSTVSFDNSNTNLPTADFVDDAPDSATANILCNTNDSGCIDSIRFNSNNINRSLPSAHDTNTNNRSWYSYGVMYNWYTASAGNGTYAMNSGNVAGDICPAGWRLPTGGTNSEFTELNRLANGNATNTTAGLVKFPDNLIFSGDFNYNAPGGRSGYGRYWSATPNGTNNAFRLGIATSAGTLVTPTGSWNKWDAFAIRCIVK